MQFGVFSVSDITRDGGYDGPIFIEDGKGEVLATRPKSFEPARTYPVTVTVDRQLVSVSVDGERVLAWWGEGETGSPGSKIAPKRLQIDWEDGGRKRSELF